MKNDVKDEYKKQRRKIDSCTRDEVSYTIEEVLIFILEKLEKLETKDIETLKCTIDGDK